MSGVGRESSVWPYRSSDPALKTLLPRAGGRAPFLALMCAQILQAFELSSVGAELQANKLSVFRGERHWGVIE